MRLPRLLATLTLLVSSACGPGPAAFEGTTSGSTTSTRGYPHPDAGTGSTGSAGSATSGGGSGAGTSTGSTGTACLGAGAPCQPLLNPCDRGVTGCDSSGESICSDTGADPSLNGSACDAGAVCFAGSCTSCAAGSACKPANPCDLGAISCATGQAICADRGPGTALNGTACDAGRVCSAGQCLLAAPLDGGGWPQVPPGSAVVLAAPNLVLITYDGDGNRAALEASTTWLATGGYLAEVAGEYGVGNGTVQMVHLSDTPPTSDQAALQTYLNSHLSDGSLPAFAANNLYILAIPAGSASTSFCNVTGGFHSFVYDDAYDQVLIAACPDCSSSVSEVEVTISHEVVEASTDPYVTSWQISDPTNPWTFLGGEVGDLCASNSLPTQDPTGTYSAQLIWSNQAAAAGQPPCVPWNAATPYLALTASPTTTQTVAAGGSATFTLTGWSSLPVSAAWNIGAEDGDYLVDFMTTPTLNTSSITQGGTATLTLTAEASASSGQHGAAWVICQDPNSGQTVGSTMVAIVVQ